MDKIYGHPVVPNQLWQEHHRDKVCKFEAPTSSKVLNSTILSSNERRAYKEKVGWKQLYKESIDELHLRISRQKNEKKSSIYRTNSETRTYGMSRGRRLLDGAHCQSHNISRNINRTKRATSCPPSDFCDIDHYGSSHFAYGHFMSKHEETSVPTPSRGRERQKWNGNVKLCCTTIPFRFTTCKEDGSKTIEFLIITSRQRGDWVLPRGGWDSDETRYQCAMRETLEEAGVEGKIIASFGSYIRPSPKGYNTKIFNFIMNVENVRDHWAEENERRRKWVSLGKIINDLESIFQRSDLVALWKRLLHCAQVKLPGRRITRKNVYVVFKQMSQLFDARKIPIDMVPNGALEPIPWHAHAQIQYWLDRQFPLATTVRGQPNQAKKTIHYKRPWTYFIVQRDGKIIEYVDRKRPVTPGKTHLLDILRNQATRSHRRTFSELMFKFLWVLTIHGELLVTQEYARSHEDRYTNHGDLVPANLSDYVDDENEPEKNASKFQNIVQNVDLQGNYRGIARMGGELVFGPRCGRWVMNNISGFSLARITPQCSHFPLKKSLKQSDAFIENLEYESLVELRDYLEQFIPNFNEVVLLSGDIGGRNLKEGLRPKVKSKESGNERLKRHQIRMEDLLRSYFKFYST